MNPDAPAHLPGPDPPDRRTDPSRDVVRHAARDVPSGPRGSGPARATLVPARGFLFAVHRCTGCAACELACSTENELGWGRSWRRIVTLNPERRPGAPAFHLSLACHHCDAAPCVRECPTLALGRDAATDAVLINEARCIGCRYCSWVCPYDAPRFDDERSVMRKCTLCHHRLLVRAEPACVEACPTGALKFGPLVGEEATPGFPETPAKPRIRFTRAGRRARAPETTWELPSDVAASFAAARPLRPAVPISLRSELPLWLFTTAVAVLVGWVLAWAVAGTTAVGVGAGDAGAGAVVGEVGASGFRRVAPGTLRLRVHPTGFLTLATVALVVATLHLGRKVRAWRALANVRRSRLSREIAGFGMFVATCLAMLVWDSLGVGAASGAGAAAGPADPSSSGSAVAWLAAVDWALPWLAGAAGIVALFFVDRVYDPVRGELGRPLHSADVLLTGPAVAATLLETTPAFVALAAVKLVLYVRRMMVRPADPAAPSRRYDAGTTLFSGARRPRGAWLLGMQRVGLGLVLPPVVWSLGLAGWSGWGGWPLLLFLGGEMIDRAQLYEEAGAVRAPSVS